MAGRKIKDERDARRCLEQAEESGLPRAAWARREGIDGRSLNMWRMNLEKREPQEPPPLRLVELVASASPAAEPFCIRVGPYSLDVPDPFDDAALEKLLRVLARC